MKNKKTVYLIGLGIFALIVYLLFFRKKKPENIQAGDISIQPGVNGLPTIFKCSRTINKDNSISGTNKYPQNLFPLQYGDCGTAVLELQKYLNTKGKNLTTDAKFGRKTEKALNEIYQATGRPQTGKLTYGQMNLLVSIPQKDI
jgi:peptidoglycan hydrolase-like protein with peptidoglycan-binding domain